MLKNVMNLAILAALGWAAWYGYTHWTAAQTDSPASAEGTAFNCRQALAILAEDQACRTSDSCSLSSDELADMKKRESDIEQYCN